MITTRIHDDSCLFSDAKTSNSVKSSGASASAEENVNVHSIDTDYLNAQDRLILTRQLGFVPGNAICVAARANERYTPTSILTTEIKITTKNSFTEPTVLQLYPLAVRDCYAGGKTDGRKFKSRKRGNITKQEQRQQQDDDDDTKPLHLENDKFDEQQQQQQQHPSDEQTNTKPPRESSSQNDVNKDAANTSKQQNKQRRDWRTSNNTGIIEPFPTIFWLTCPKLRILISRLETGKDNNVKQLEMKLKQNPQALQSMKEAHLAYGKLRWDLLTQDDREKVIHRGWKPSLGVERGVAGIRRHDTIKCLHTHAAHYLSGEEKNIVGKWVMEAVQSLIQEDAIKQKQSH